MPQPLTITRVYVAAPYSGDIALNVDFAESVGRELERAGLFPFVPHSALQWACDLPYEAVMAQCLPWVAVCSALLRVGGHSPGADREVAHACALGIPVFLSVEEVIVHAHR